MISLDNFVRELQNTPPQPERLALAIAGIAYPEIEIEAYLAQIDQLADYVEKRLAGKGNATTAHRFLHIFCHELGFTGNRDEYYHPDNSYLNIVLETRRGLPIMLCLLCVAVARRLHLPVFGVGFPGHFMACYRDQTGSWLLDPFNGEVIAPNDAASYLGRIFGVQPTLNQESFQEVSPEAWAQRILFNLRNVYLSRHESAMAIKVLNYLLVLMPRHPVLWRERGLLHHQLQEWQDALFDLRRSYFLFGQFALVWGEEQQKEELVARMGNEERSIIEIYQQIIQQIRKQN